MTEGFAEIDSPLARRGIENALRIKGEQTFPELVDVRDLKYVYDIGAQGFLAAEFAAAENAAVSVAGVASYVFKAIAPQGYATAGALGADIITNGAQQNIRVLGANHRIVFDAAGIAAFAGKVIRIAWSIRDSASSLNFQITSEDYTLPAAVLTHQRPINSSFWRGLVPNGLALTCSVTVLDGTNFPANTTGKCGMYTARAGVGVALPL